MKLHQPTLETCSAYRKAISKGGDPHQTVVRLASAAGVHRTAIYKRLRRGGELPPYATRFATRGHARQFVPESLPSPVERDPCPRCATRRDIGCKHTVRA